MLVQKGDFVAASATARQNKAGDAELFSIDAAAADQFVKDRDFVNAAIFADMAASEANKPGEKAKYLALAAESFVRARQFRQALTEWERLEALQTKHPEATNYTAEQIDANKDKTLEKIKQRYGS